MISETPYNKMNPVRLVIWICKGQDIKDKQKTQETRYKRQELEDHYWLNLYLRSYYLP